MRRGHKANDNWRSAKPLRVLIGACVAVFITGCAETKDFLVKVDQKIGELFSQSQTNDADGEEAYAEAKRLQAANKPIAAARKLQKAAEASHPAATYELGLAYNTGIGVDKEVERAAHHINAAAGLGEPRALHFLGSAYFHGDGVERDYETAALYLADAATAGHADAQYLLGECFSNGWGVVRNQGWAARWYGKAAWQGHADAQYAYGVVHRAGMGVPRNDVQAYRWLMQAAMQKQIEAAKLTDQVNAGLSGDVADAVQAQVLEFTPAPTTTFADPPTVRYVQHRLNQLGFQAGTVDGLVGPATRRAVRAFNEKSGRDTGGDITPGLVEALFNAR